MITPQQTLEIDPETPSLISATNYIFLAAFIYTLVPICLFVVGGGANKDEAIILTSIALLFPSFLWTAGILLRNKSKVGLYFWWLSSILVLLSFPLGTLIGALAYMHLSKPDAKEELK